MSKICKNVEHPVNVFTPHSSTLKILIFAHFLGQFVIWPPLQVHTRPSENDQSVEIVHLHHINFQKKIWGLWRIIPAAQSQF